MLSTSNIKGDTLLIFIIRLYKQKEPYTQRQLRIRLLGSMLANVVIIQNKDNINRYFYISKYIPLSVSYQETLLYRKHNRYIFCCYNQKI